MGKRDDGDIDRAGIVPRATFAVTPHATNALAYQTHAIWVGVSGHLTVRFAGNTADTTLKNVAAGMWHPMFVTHVRATSTATDIVAAYPA